MFSITEIKQAADIRDVWAALGGGKLRGNRGQAFWRGGNGYSVSMDIQRGLWHDFVTSEGGDVIGLIQQVCGGDFRETMTWLSDFTGMSLSESSRPSDNCPGANWLTDLKWATWWAMAAEALAEHALDELPSWSLQRRGPTALLQAIRLGDAALVNEYREWRRRNPEFTAAMAHAGKLHDARIQRRLAHWIRSLDEPSAA